MSESAELIRELRARGVSQAAIARAVGRSDRYLRLIESGAKPGTSLTPALRALASSGRTEPVPYRVSANGEPVPVRAPRAAGVSSRAPMQPVTTYTTRVMRGGGGTLTLRWVEGDSESQAAAIGAGDRWLRAAPARANVYVSTPREGGGWFSTGPVSPREARAGLARAVTDGDVAALAGGGSVRYVPDMAEAAELTLRVVA
mgnify:CR=1 FL=1